jgi:hypothetical protein
MQTNNRGAISIIGLGLIALVAVAALYVATNGTQLSILGGMGYPHVAPTATTLVYDNSYWRVWEVTMPFPVRSIPQSNFDFQFGVASSWRENMKIGPISAEAGDFWLYPTGTLMGYPACSPGCAVGFGSTVFFLKNMPSFNSQGGALTYIQDTCGSSSCNVAHYTGWLQDSTPPISIHSNKFYVAVYTVGYGGSFAQATSGVGKFPFSEIYYVPESIEIPSTPTYINSTISPYCPVPSGYIIATETFSGPQDIKMTDLRFPVNYFCGAFPVIETNLDTGLTAQLTAPYVDMLAGKTVSVPVGSTWTVFYGAKATGTANLICPDGSVYNADSNACEVYPGVVHVCSDGVFDASKGLCTIQADTIVDCPIGSYDKDMGKCVYYPDVENVCTKGVFDFNIGKCIFYPDTTAVCSKGSYNADSGKCEFTPELANICTKGIFNSVTDKCEFTPDVQVVCPKGTFNYETGLCEFSPSIENICSDGAAYNTMTDKCEIFPPNSIVCTIGSYSTVSGMCQVEPPTQPVCERGTLNTATNKCEVDADTLALCDKGYYDLGKEACVYHPPIQADCPPSSVYNIDKQVCEWDPNYEEQCNYEGKFSPRLDQCVAPPKVSSDCSYTCEGFTEVTHADGSIEQVEQTFVRSGSCLNDETQTKMECKTTNNCDNGMYDESLHYCVFPANFQVPICISGVWNEEDQICEGSIEVTPAPSPITGWLTSKDTDWTSIGIIGIAIIGGLLYAHRTYYKRK